MAGFVEISEVEAPFQSDPKFGFYLGLVIDRSDPQSLGRIKFRIPGMIEESQWSQCMGMFASEQQGIAWVPELGAMVFVFFHQGNTTHPFWIPGPWAITNTGNEVPSESQVDPDIKTIKTKKFKIVFDDTGTDKLTISSLDNSVRIILDDKNGVVEVAGPSVLIGQSIFQKLATATLISQINAATFGGNSIDTPIAAVDNVNQTKVLKAG